MKIDILTLFPEMFEPLKTSILKRAAETGKIEVNIINIRDYSKDKHKKCDDYTFGGGPGMLMMPQPIHDAITSIKGYELAHKIYLSPKGEVFSQEKSKNLSNLHHIILLCGHYEGVDQRILDTLIDEEISIGDYVLTGGELPAMVIVDAVARHIEGVLHDSESAVLETFEDNLLEYPQYTKPRVFNGMEVPEVLLSGDHKKIAEWRKEESLKLTKKRRPDLFIKVEEKLLTNNKKQQKRK